MPTFVILRTTRVFVALIKVESSFIPGAPQALWEKSSSLKHESFSSAPMMKFIDLGISSFSLPVNISAKFAS